MLQLHHGRCGMGYSGVTDPEWDVQLPLVLMACCDVVQESTRCTPALRTPPEKAYRLTPDSPEYAHQLQDRMEVAHQCA